VVLLLIGYNMLCDRCRLPVTRETIDLTAGGGCGPAVAQSSCHTDTEFVGYDEASLQLDGCQVVGLLGKGQPVQEAEATGGGGDCARGQWG